MKKTLLIIDDDALFCDTIKDHLGNRLDVLFAHSGNEGVNLCIRRDVDIVLLDKNLPDGEGHTFCASILAHNEQTKIIVITGFANFRHAVSAVKAGACDYLSKPIELEELDLAVNQAMRTLDLEKKERLCQLQNDIENAMPVLVGGCLEPLQRLINQASRSESAVLITGETGTGKNVVARCIHDQGASRQAPYIVVNCAALPETLIEAELFGYEQGAFTGATSTRRGLFEMAKGGTLVLDEIGELPHNLQAKLLGVLENKEIKKIGSDTFRPVDVRIIAITNRDLETAIHQKLFREDLYYRLNVIPIHVQPLRERRSDISELCSHLLNKIAGDDAVIPSDEQNILMDYPWPGNVRELRNILERAALFPDGRELHPAKLLCSPIPPRRPPEKEGAYPDCVIRNETVHTLRDVVKHHIAHELKAQNGIYSHTARSLGISLNTLKRKIREYGIPKTEAL